MDTVNSTIVAVITTESQLISLFFMAPPNKNPDALLTSGSRSLLGDALEPP